MMIRTLVAIILLVLTFSVYGQISGTFIVKGDMDKYYPVAFTDGGWGHNIPTELTLGRSDVHTDSEWRGAVMAKFRYHVTNWGHGADFIDANLNQNANAGAVIKSFIGGWVDVTANNAYGQIVVWLRGGSTTYYYSGNYDISPMVYDGVQNALPWQPPNFYTLSYKTTPDNYVTVNGVSVSGDFLSQGNISAKKVKVTQTGWADYVFDSAYALKPLNEVDDFIKLNKRLPGIPAAKEIESAGLDMGEIIKKQQEKIEELTLYIIQQNKRLEQLEKKMAAKN
jgi:hypothetical protein